MAKHKGLYKRGQTWWMSYAGPDGKIRRESARTADFRDAGVKLTQRKNEVLAGRDPLAAQRIKPHTFKELKERYLEWCEHQKSYPSKKKFMKHLEKIFGNIPLKAFNTMVVEKWQGEKLKVNKPATVNRHLEVLKHSFKKAHEWEMVDEETVKRVRRVKLIPENNRRLRYLSKEECQGLIKACDENKRLNHLQPIVILALNTGMRKEEMLSLEWEKHVDLRHGFILLDKTKNGERRQIPINQTLREALQGIVRRLDSPYLFVDSQGRRFGDVRNAFTTALKKVEIERCDGCKHERQRTELKTPGNCPLCGEEMRRYGGIRDFRFHDLRHTFASHLVMAGVDLMTIKELLGHKTLTMTLRYAHLAPAHAAKAVRILEEVMGSSAQKVHNPEEKGLTVNG